MRVLITGTSSGIGLATANKFLNEGFEVIGIDINESKISHEKYIHFRADISEKKSLPEIKNIDILVNNAGVQNSEDDIKTNLYGTINVTEKYGFDQNIKSIIFNSSASALTGFEFSKYVASKAGVLGYMKHIATKVSSQGATCNAVCFGGVSTELNSVVMKDKSLRDQIMKVTPLKKWISPEEAAERIYFLTVINKSCTGQAILIDNGEKDLNDTFVWPNY